MKQILLYSLILFSSVNVYAQQNGWKTFNHKFGFTIQLPKHFKQGALTASDIQYYDSDYDSFDVVVQSYGVDGSPSKQLNDFYNLQLKTRGNSITYKYLGKDFFVVSGAYGTGNDQSIYYDKYIQNNTDCHILTISYSSEDMPLMDTILPKVVRSFKIIK